LGELSSGSSLKSRECGRSNPTSSDRSVGIVRVGLRPRSFFLYRRMWRQGNTARKIRKMLYLSFAPEWKQQTSSQATRSQVKDADTLLLRNNLPRISHIISLQIDSMFFSKSTQTFKPALKCPLRTSMTCVSGTMMPSEGHLSREQTEDFYRREGLSPHVTNLT
jgi:hypothetical protein